MKDYIERYVYDVARRLPEKSREEVKEELKANIYDMLSDKPSEEEIKKVLMELGTPRQLAMNYREKKRYLISPEWMDDYLFVLKLVIYIVAIVTFVASMISTISNQAFVESFDNIVSGIAEVFANTFQSVFQSFAIVTLIFVIIDHYHKGGRKEEWKPENLPEVPIDKKTSITAKKMIIELVFTICFGFLFLYVLYNNSLFVGWFNTNGNWHLIAPLFNNDYVRPFVYLYGISLLIEIISIAIRLKALEWNVVTGLAHTIAKLFGLVILVIFVTSSNLINIDFINQMAQHFSLTTSEVANNISRGLSIFAIIISILTALDLVKTWVMIIKKSGNIV